MESIRECIYSRGVKQAQGYDSRGVKRVYVKQIKYKVWGRLVDTAQEERYYMSAFEIKRDTEDVYGIRLWDGQCLWFNSREERDIAFLLIQ